MEDGDTSLIQIWKKIIKCKKLLYVVYDTLSLIISYNFTKAIKYMNSDKKNNWRHCNKSCV